MSRLTEEQFAVVKSKASLLAVSAFAGTGKTSTLVEYAKARPKARILYIAFNKSVATEAGDRFPDNVDCRTTHSLAFAGFGRKFSDKLGNPQAWEVAQACSCNPRQAKVILTTLNAWLCSADEALGRFHVDMESVRDEVEAGAVVQQAKRAWELMRSPDSPLRMPHDGYLKLWALSKPKLKVDILLLDEAQDTNPLTLDLVMNQRHATIVLVGDRHQGIYGFRRAVNAMELVEADEQLALTQSFRFGQGIADVATHLLRAFKGEVHSVKGRDDILVKWLVDRSQHYALIGRTNAGLFGAAASLVEPGKERKLHFVGGFDSYPFGKVLDAFYLWCDERAKIKDASIGRFASFSDFERYGAEADDAEVKALVRVVDTYRSRVPVIYNSLKAAEVAVEGRAVVTLTTAHKGKGLEWEQIELADDFIELPPERDDYNPEEINLLYVAVTRAIKAIRLPESLVHWLAAEGFVEPSLARERGVPAKPSQAVTSTTPEVTDRQVADWLAVNAHRLSESTVNELGGLVSIDR